MGQVAQLQVVLKMFMFTVQIFVRFVLDSLCNWRLQIVPSLLGNRRMQRNRNKLPCFLVILMCVGVLKTFKIHKKQTFC